MLNAEQFVATQKANVETLIALGNKAFEGTEQLVALNVQATKATLAESIEVANAVMSTKDLPSLVALQQSLAQSASEKSAAYGRQVYDIVSATAAEFGKYAESLGADLQKQIAALVDNAMKNAPAGSENAFSLVKASVAAANDAYESAQKAAKQAADVAEANFAALQSSVSPKAAPAKARRAA